MNPSFKIETYDKQFSIDELWEFIENNLKLKNTSGYSHWISKNKLKSLRKKDNIFLAIKGETMIGCIVVDEGDIEIIDEAEIEILCIKRWYRRKGIGKCLLECAEKKVKKKKRYIKAMSLKSFMARGFYEKMGFEVDRQRGFPYDRTWHLRKKLR